MTIHVFAYEEEVWTSKWEDYLREADIYHILHFKRFSNWLTKKAAHLQMNKPYIITSGGTDINEDLKHEEVVRLVESVIDLSCAITVFSQDGYQKLINVYPELVDKVFVIPQSVWLPETDQSVSFQLDGSPAFLLPAGLREVKDIFYLFDELHSLRVDYPYLTFTVVGEPLDHTILRQVNELRKEHDWFRYIEGVPFEQMAAVYKQAEIVLNTSKSEGQSNALLEAMYCEKLVMARRNAGNESVITDFETGLLFDHPSEFRTKFKEIFHSNKKTELKQQAKAYIERNHSLKKEMKQFLKVYEHCLK